MSTPSPAPRLLLALCVALLSALLACPASVSVWPEDGGFEDHTVSRIDDRAAFETLAAVGPSGTAVLKFVIVDFGDPKAQTIRFLDGRFYEFHDEWYWFRLLNGERVPGMRARPVQGHRFASVAEVVEWTRARHGPLPLDLQLIDERLYSQRFYDVAVGRTQRTVAVGTLVHMPARSGEHAREQLWGFELEYSDAIEAPQLELFFAGLASSLPAEIAEQLRYIARSPAQVELVARLRASEHPLAGQLTSYAELAIPGEVEVYNPGLIAGRLRKLPSDPERAAALLTAGDPGAIWIMATVPDELPAAAGLLTAVPQTPLAHVNLLARNRGIPNAYVGGLLDDPQLDQLSRIHAPVVVLAEADGNLVIEPISEASYAQWRALVRPPRPKLTPVEPASLPYTLDLEAEPLSRVPELRRIVGGKAAGFPVLREAGVTMPERALAITTRAYVEHLAELRPAIADALATREFAEDARVRYLLLEGQDDFDARFAGEADQRWLEAFVAAHPRSAAKHDAIANLLARGGIRRAIRERPLNPDAAAAIDAALHAHFGHFAPSQGLRFRSSSTVEDLEGFSGAGLYDSNTGFLDPEAQARKKDRKKSVAWALRKTWASYWSWEAFEERRMAGVPHLDGAMAVLVHARFDDPLERSNGVLTLTLDRPPRRGTPQAPLRPRVTMELDVQLGALSVTNPPPERAGEVLPEVDRVTLAEPSATPRIERLAASSEHAEPILDDAALVALFKASIAVADHWLWVENLDLDPARTRNRVTLDIEFRALAPGWPAYAEGVDPAPARVVIKQVRSLDPGLPAGIEPLLDQPIPRDLLLFADRIERRRCRSRRAQLELLELRSDPMAGLGHELVPFLARLQLQARGLEGGPRSFDLDHREYAALARGTMAQGGPWSLALDIEPTVVPAVGVGIERIEWDAGLLRLFLDGRLLGEEPAACSVEVLFASPDEFLRGLF